MMRHHAMMKRKPQDEGKQRRIKCILDAVEAHVQREERAGFAWFDRDDRDGYVGFMSPAFGSGDPEEGDTTEADQDEFEAEAERLAAGLEARFPGVVRARWSSNDYVNCHLDIYVEGLER